MVWTLVEIRGTTLRCSGRNNREISGGPLGANLEKRKTVDGMLGITAGESKRKLWQTSRKKQQFDKFKEELAGRIMRETAK